MLNKLEKAKIYKYYMKQYFVKPDPEVYYAFREKIKTAENTMFCFGTRYILLQCGLAFLDYNNNYMQHTQIFSYDLLNTFLHLDESEPSAVFYDYSSSPLIVYHPLGTTGNQRLLSLITHLYSYRNLLGQKTLILSELDILNEIMDSVTPITNFTDIGKIIDEPELYLS